MRFRKSIRAALFLRFHTLCVLLIAATAAATEAPAASFEQDVCGKPANGMKCLRLAQSTADAKMANGRLQRFCTDGLPSAFAAFEPQIQAESPESQEETKRLWWVYCCQGDWLDAPGGWRCMSFKDNLPPESQSMLLSTADSECLLAMTRPAPEWKEQACAFSRQSRQEDLAPLTGILSSTTLLILAWLYRHKSGSPRNPSPTP
ncbi:hypothetical protein [Myxococcus fulvus]|uniref:hypothetical protein n=1 Tax=Myxococcus fulvus TaxID=33 RepID=UPI001160D4F4|nr:hypothetical protein [Myxococcus fulvus]